MSAPRTEGIRLPSLTTAHVVLMLGLGVLIVGMIVGLVWLAGPGGQDRVFAWLSSVFALIASATGAGALVQSRRTAAAQAGMHETVRVVQHQTNGNLDRRIEAATTSAVRSALVAAGVEVPDDQAGV